MLTVKYNYTICVTGHCSLSAVTHAPFHASVLRPKFTLEEGG